MGCAAWIINPVAQCDVGKEFVISVDLLYGKDHSLHPTESPQVKSERAVMLKSSSFFVWSPYKKRQNWHHYIGSNSIMRKVADESRQAKEQLTWCTVPREVKRWRTDCAPSPCHEGRRVPPTWCPPFSPAQAVPETLGLVCNAGSGLGLSCREKSPTIGDWNALALSSSWKD